MSRKIRYLPGNIKLSKKQMSLLAAVFSKPNIVILISGPSIQFLLFEFKFGQMSLCSIEYHS
jgi:hypothetical protein